LTILGWLRISGIRWVRISGTHIRNMPIPTKRIPVCATTS
jgi:hypothetical protein